MTATTRCRCLHTLYCIPTRVLEYHGIAILQYQRPASSPDSGSSKLASVHEYVLENTSTQACHRRSTARVFACVLSLSRFLLPRCLRCPRWRESRPGWQPLWRTPPSKTARRNRFLRPALVDPLQRQLCLSATQSPRQLLPLRLRAWCEQCQSFTASPVQLRRA